MSKLNTVLNVWRKSFKKKKNSFLFYTKISIGILMVIATLVGVGFSFHIGAIIWFGAILGVVVCGLIHYGKK